MINISVWCTDRRTELNSIIFVWLIFNWPLTESQCMNSLTIETIEQSQANPKVAFLTGNGQSQQKPEQVEKATKKINFRVKQCSVSSLTYVIFIRFFWFRNKWTSRYRNKSHISAGTWEGLTISFIITIFFYYYHHYYFPFHYLKKLTTEKNLFETPQNWRLTKDLARSPLPIFFCPFHSLYLYI